VSLLRPKPQRAGLHVLHTQVSRSQRPVGDRIDPTLGGIYRSRLVRVKTKTG